MRKSLQVVQSSHKDFTEQARSNKVYSNLLQLLPSGAKTQPSHNRANERSTMPTERDYEIQRVEMVEYQIRRRGISDPRVLQAFLDVPRHRFVPEAYRDASYSDRPLPIGEGQTISQPYMVARMTEALALSGHERVLEVGTGSGYQAAILAKLCRHVYSIERHRVLSKRAAAVLAELGINNVTLIVGDGSRGYPEAAPYDAIIVTAAAQSVPQALKEQLANGGRLVIPVGPPMSQILLLIRKENGNYYEESLEPCVFVPLIEGEIPEPEPPTQ